MTATQKFWAGFGILCFVTLVGLLVFRVVWVTFVDNYEMGFTYDNFSGKIERIESTGWIVRNPIKYSVHHLDLRPYQVTITANTSVQNRILNAKLVRFNPNGLDKFVEWHGRSGGDEHSNMLEILKCYAFDRDDGKDCPFLTVVSELAPGQGMNQTTTAPK
jgi:hypothetical protein